MRILIAGTSGGIGGAVKALADERGHEVIEINRNDWNSLPKIASIEAVVFATGMCPIKPMQLTSDELFEETFRVNCTLFMRLIRWLVSEKLYSSLGMKVIAVSSISANEGWAGGAAYCASKGALSALCRALKIELSAKRISVEAIEPQYVKTRMFDNGAGRMGVPVSQAIAPKRFAEMILEKIEHDREIG